MGEVNYKIAICDDNSTDLHYLSSLVADWGRSSGKIIRIKTFKSAEAFLFNYAEDKDYDILLLDIEMGNLNGVQLAKKIRKENDAVQIVFITGYSDYIAEGYEVSALHYLIKPINLSKFFSTLDRAMAKLKQNERALLLKTGGETIRIPLYEIRFIEVQGNYVTVHSYREYTAKYTLKQIEKELDERFFRTNRSYIINISYIRRITKKEVYLADGTRVPLARKKYEPLNRAIISQA